ncbi:MAG: hypothetical protein F9K22_15055 [Bacteroidetes bacterium]|nr:MAG: hypothetical protein F9K22_15055 [Bacteroidota bacterium]
MPVFAGTLPAQDSAAVRPPLVDLLRPRVPEFLKEQPSLLGPLRTSAPTTNPGSLNRWGYYTPELMDPSSKPIDLAAPWKLYLQRQEQYKTMNTILGSVQVAGTGYLLYRHLREEFKKKK